MKLPQLLCTTAKLSKPGGLIIGNKGYSGASTRGYALIMLRAYRNNSLTEED